MFNLSFYTISSSSFIFQILLLLFSFPSLSAQTRDTTYQIVKKIPLQTTFITTDALKQWYVATTDGRLIKYDKTGQFLFEYTNDRLGVIGTVDATNPFNILVYYPDLATLILLDRTLSVIKTIDLFALAIFEPQAVAIANDNNIWIYDPIAAQLKKINKEGAILFQSKNLTQAIGIAIKPTFLLERNNRLLLSDPAHGFFIFDAFGQLQQHIPILGIQQFQLLGQTIFYVEEGKFKYLSLAALKETVFELPNLLPAIAHVGIMDKHLLVATTDSLLFLARL